MRTNSNKYLGKERPVIVLLRGSEGTIKGKSARKDSNLSLSFGVWQILVALWLKANLCEGDTQASSSPLLISSRACG